MWQNIQGAGAAVAGHGEKIVISSSSIRMPKHPDKTSEGQIPYDLTFNWNIINKKKKTQTKYNQRH